MNKQNVLGNEIQNNVLTITFNPNLYIYAIVIKNLINKLTNTLINFITERGVEILTNSMNHCQLRLIAYEECLFLLTYQIMFFERVHYQSSYNKSGAIIFPIV